MIRRPPRSEERRVLDGEVHVRGVHDRLRGRLPARQVVAVEADVDVAERDRLSHELADQVAQAGGQHGTATVDPDDRDALPTRLLDDLMSSVRRTSSRSRTVFSLKSLPLPGLSGPG
jgi:hypothetical protein